MPDAIAAAARAGTGFFRRLVRASKQVFHEVTGAAFAILALGWCSASLRSWQHGVPLWQVGLGLSVAALMAAFSVVSFLAARHVP
jgi:hypothetical protein